MAKSLVRQTGEAGDGTCNPWFTRRVTYPLHHSGSYSPKERVCNLSYLRTYADEREQMTKVVAGELRVKV